MVGGWLWRRLFGFRIVLILVENVTLAESCDLSAARTALAVWATTQFAGCPRSLVTSQIGHSLYLECDQYVSSPV
jgi:hypothetical protein